MADIRMTVVGSYQSTLKALASGKLKPDTYVFLKDKEMLSWVDHDGVLHLLGDSVQQISNFPTKGLQNTLYIKGTTPYIYDGENYVPLNRDFYDRLNKVEKQLEGLINPETGEIVPVIEYVETQIQPVQTQVDEIKENLGTINIVI